MTVNERSYCHYGPGTAYASPYGFIEGNIAALYGKNKAGDWLWVQGLGWDQKCWIKATVVSTEADLENIPVVEHKLPLNPAVSPPENVHAIRNGANVTVSWSDMSPQVELSYLVEVKVCLAGEIVEQAYYTTYTSYTLIDEGGCAESSSGQVYLRNKLGYSVPVFIVWP